MAKTEESKQEELQEQEPAQQQSESSGGRSTLEILLQDGEVTITAESRKDIYRQADELVAQIPDGVKWTRPAVEYDSESGIFSQTYYITDK